MRLELFLRDRWGRGRRDRALETESRGQGECYFLGGKSLLTSSWSCRTCRCGADRQFVWTGGQARSRGSERMLRTPKVSDSKRGLGSRGDIVIYWLLGGSSWPEFEITVTPTGNGNFCALIFTLHKLCSKCYANTYPNNSWPIFRNQVISQLSFFIILK